MVARIPLAVEFGKNNINNVTYDFESLIKLKQSDRVQESLRNHTLFVRTYYGNLDNPCQGMDNIIGYVREWNDVDAVIEITNPKAIDFFNRVNSIDNYILSMSYMGEYLNNGKFRLVSLNGSYLIDKNTYTPDTRLISAI